jgi:hypothetical protein
LQDREIVGFRLNRDDPSSWIGSQESKGGGPNVRSGYDGRPAGIQDLGIAIPNPLADTINASEIVLPFPKHLPYHCAVALARPQVKVSISCNAYSLRDPSMREMTTHESGSKRNNVFDIFLDPNEELSNSHGSTPAAGTMSFSAPFNTCSFHAQFVSEPGAPTARR